MYIQHFLILSLVQAVLALSEIYIGGVFDAEDEIDIAAFSNAINQINRNHAPPHLKVIVTTVKKDDSFDATKKVCDLLSKRVAAIFGGPSSLDTSIHIQSICDSYGVPYIQAKLDVRDALNTHVINLFPHWTILSRAYVDLVYLWGWKNFTLLYEDNTALVKLRDVFKFSPKSPMKITLQQLPPGDDFRMVLRSVKSRGETNILVDCSVDNVYRVLKQAQQVGMMTENHHYLITSLDMDTINLEDFRYGSTNITAFRLINSSQVEVINASRSLKYTMMMETGDSYVSRNTNGFFLQTETALIFDAVQMFANASFKMKDASSSGSSLFNEMKMVQLGGLSGLVGFDGNGFRSVFSLDLLELHETGLEKVGYWGSGHKEQTSNGLHITPPRGSKENESAQQETLIVTTLLNDPYVMYKNSLTPVFNNDRFEGYCVDLMNMIVKILNINYTLVPVPDGGYGGLNKITLKWDGMIRELVENRADIAIADLTITHEREQAVDFTTPFMDLGISILYQKPKPASPSLLSFLSPFSTDVWLYMAVTYLGVSVILFILARLSPYEWDNPHPCIQEPEVLQNDFSILNSMWFTIGSLMQQGSDIAPKAASTRLVAGIWWFFTLILISSYTANLTAFLTVENLESEISNVEDLAKQTKIKYGSIATGSTLRFFQDSQRQTYRTIHQFMTSCKPSCIVSKNGEGIARVEEGNYAFFMESSSIEYNIERKCNLTKIGGQLDTKFYGIALQKKSPYRSKISEIILRLQEDGTLRELKKKWWQEERKNPACTENKAATTLPLTLEQVGGVFVVLISGVMLAATVAVTEFVWKTRKVASCERESVCHELVKELAFVVKCRGTKKLTKKLPTEPETGLTLPLSKYSLNDRDMYS